MKFLIYLFSIIVLITFSSCSKGYTHEKIVTNNSRDPITVLAGCCENIQEYVIQPGESETVFACIYQQLSKPQISDLNWEIKLIKEEQTLFLNQPEKWLNKSSDRKLQFEYLVVD